MKKILNIIIWVLLALIGAYVISTVIFVLSGKHFVQHEVLLFSLMFQFAVFIFGIVQIVVNEKTKPHRRRFFVLYFSAPEHRGSYSYQRHAHIGKHCQPHSGYAEGSQ